ncbi:MAG: LemA family protein [Chitinophagaceae bacterium]
MKSKKTLLVIAGIVLIIVIFLVTSYNGLVSKQENVKKNWSEVQSTYQRRLDLIPNLVNVVKGVSDFESSTLEQIATARSRAVSGQNNASFEAGNFASQTAAQDTLASAVNRMIITIEKYPTLKGTQAYAGLQTQLEGTERRIKVARNDFNESVAVFNRSVRSFPTSIAAAVFGFRAEDGFAAVQGAEKNVEIKF